MKRSLNDFSVWGTCFVLAAFCTLYGCGVRATGTPLQEVSAFYRTIGNGTIARIQGHDGMTILICSDVAGGSHGGTSKMTTNPPFQKVEGYSVSHDGRRLDWLIEKRKCQKTTCRLNNKEFDLQVGTLLLVKTKGGDTKTDQLAQDLSDVSPNTESFMAFAKKNPDVSTLLEMVEEEKAGE